MGDNPVHRCVSILRRALGDHAHRPRYIGTIPKRGYRVVAPVETVQAAAGEGEQARPIPLSIDILSRMPTASGGCRDAEPARVPGAAGRSAGEVLEGVLRMGGRELRITAVLAGSAELRAGEPELLLLEIGQVVGFVRSVARDVSPLDV
jgi:hypothetical protein